jgi:hypothetical protein
VTTKTLVLAGAALETATGVLLMADPGLVVRLLIGANLSGGGVAVARVCGLALFALGLACWPSRTGVSAQAIRALFAYNFLFALYIAYLGIGGGFTAYLLWPACILHGLMALFLARPTYEARIART